MFGQGVVGHKSELTKLWVGDLMGPEMTLTLIHVIVPCPKDTFILCPKTGYHGFHG
jgi:hypothetical protein